MQAQTLTWKPYTWNVIERDIILAGEAAKLRIGFDDLSGDWFWMMGVPGEFRLYSSPSRSGTFNADTEDEAVARAMRLAKKWGATW